MCSILELVRARLSGVAAAFANPAEADLVSTVCDDSLRVTIAAAISNRKQGRIDLSIKQLTRANRVQLDAIEGIQKTVDALLDRPESEIVFAKYRQHYPFAMGIEGGDSVLELIALFDTRLGRGGQVLCQKLHDLEEDKHAEAERLAFFEQRFADGSEDDTIQQARKAVQSISNDLLEVKLRLLDAAIQVAEDFLSSVSAQRLDVEVKYNLAKWLYVLVTSPTKTCRAGEISVKE